MRERDEVHVSQIGWEQLESWPMFGLSTNEKVEKLVGSRCGFRHNGSAECMSDVGSMAHADIK